MKILSFFQNRALAWEPASFPIPWSKDRISIYESVLRNPAADLPDDELRFGKEGMKWVGGAMDSLFAGGGQTETAAEVYGPLKSFLQRPTLNGLEKLYLSLVKTEASGYVDRLMDYVAGGGIDRQRLEDLFVWICLKAPDREPVKIGLAILGICRNPTNATIFHALGRNDEFTQYALVSLCNTFDNSEPEIWKLAKGVDGWGKINAVERLSETTNPLIKMWLIQDGCKNSIMNEYLAYICATAGGLLDVLRSGDLDEKTLNGVADIIEALFAGGPAPDMSDYKDGAAAVHLFIGHLAKGRLSLRLCASLARMMKYLDTDEESWQASEGWTPDFFIEQKQRIESILGLQDIASRIPADFVSDDYTRFYHAIVLAEYLGLDLWPIYWDRQKAGLDSWWHLMQTDDSTRIDQVLELARQRLDLAALATGPTAQILVYGANYAVMNALDTITTRMSVFPGKGVDFVIAALKSPPVRNRNMAVKTLAEWNRENWPVGIAGELQSALAREPDSEVAETMERVLKGLPFEVTEG